MSDAEREAITVLALEVGFMISTQYGQEEPKLMPVSDIDTLVKFYQRAEQRWRENALSDDYKRGLLRGAEIAENFFKNWDMRKAYPQHEVEHRIAEAIRKETSEV